MFRPVARSPKNREHSRKVFFSDLVNLDSLSSFKEHPITMISPKPASIVLEIGGKVYVLALPGIHYRELSKPIFEVYDPSLHCWEALPTPPFWSATSESIDPPNHLTLAEPITGWMVVGDTIYLATGENDYSYNIKDNAWHCLRCCRPLKDKSGTDESKMVDIKMPIEMPHCLAWGGKLVPGYDDVFIAFFCPRVYAVLLPPNGSRAIYQHLPEIFECQGIDEECFEFIRTRYMLVEVGERKMCIMMPYPWNGSMLYVATFHVEKLKKLQDSEKAKAIDAMDASQACHHQDDGDGDGDWPFVSITLLSRGLYRIKEEQLLNYEMLNMSAVFASLRL